MSAFLLADVSVKDMHAYKDTGYIENVPKIAAKYGGVYRARGGEMEVLEGDWTPVRMVVIEFPDMEKLKAFYGCEEYQPYIKVRQELTESKIIALDGLKEPL
jgi:uncharacterized protein (DUF1330 family)